MTKKSENTASKPAVKVCPITITVRDNGKIVTTKKVPSICNMWKVNKELFKEYPAATLYIKKDGAEFMKLHLVTKSNGKVWMKNDIEASRRKAPAKPAAEPTDEIHEIHEITEADAQPAAEALTAEA